MNKANKIALVTTISLCIFLINVYFYYAQGMFFSKSYPYNTFLPGPATRFGDLYLALDQWHRLKFTGIGYGLSYFPATYLIVNLLDKFSTPQLGLVCLETIFIGYFIVYTYLSIKSGDHISDIRSTVILTFATYPVLFNWHTGNLEAVVFIFISLFVYFYKSGKASLSAIPFAYAVAMKLFPIVFGVFYLRDKKYKSILIIILSVFIFSIVPLIVFKGGILDSNSHYFSNLRASQKMYLNLMVISGVGNHYSHSLLNGIRTVFQSDFPPMSEIMKPYLIFSLIVFSLVGYFIMRRDLEPWESVSLLVICMDLLPYTSTDYKLIYFFIPLYMYISSPVANYKYIDILISSIFALIISPKGIIYFYGSPFANLNVIANPILMISLAGIIVLRDRNILRINVDN